MSESWEPPVGKLREDIRRSMLVIPENARKEVAKFSRSVDWNYGTGIRLRIVVTPEGVVKRTNRGGFVCCPLGLCLFVVATRDFRERHYPKMQGPVDGGEFQTLLRLAAGNPSLGTDDDRFHWSLFIQEWDRGEFDPADLPELFGVEEVKGEG